jgi:hypothetical protein
MVASDQVFGGQSSLLDGDVGADRLCVGASQVVQS